MQKSLPADDLSLVDADDPIFKICRITQTIDTTHGCHHDDIPSSCQQLRSGLQTEFIKFFIDR